MPGNQPKLHLLKKEEHISANLTCVESKITFMTNDQIEKFLVNHSTSEDQPVKIFFKTRSTVEGIFVRANDYAELKSKNFWRIVTGMNLENYRKSKDISHARMFNGAEFTKLSAK